jgi:hypothetical protein
MEEIFTTSRKVVPLSCHAHKWQDRGINSHLSFNSNIAQKYPKHNGTSVFWEAMRTAESPFFDLKATVKSFYKISTTAIFVSRCAIFLFSLVTPFSLLCFYKFIGKLSLCSTYSFRTKKTRDAGSIHNKDMFGTRDLLLRGGMSRLSPHVQ